MQITVSHLARFTRFRLRPSCPVPRLARQSLPTVFARTRCRYQCRHRMRVCDGGVRVSRSIFGQEVSTHCGEKCGRSYLTWIERARDRNNKDIDGDVHEKKAGSKEGQLMTCTHLETTPSAKYAPLSSLPTPVAANTNALAPSSALLARNLRFRFMGIRR